MRGVAMGDMHFVCADCQSIYYQDYTGFTCKCGGMLELAYPKKPIDFKCTAIERDRSLWRYADALPPIAPSVWKQVTMGEGGTAIISLGKQLWGKADYCMPTLSFKDRGAAVLVSHMSSQGVRHAIADSSGNAGTAIAAYCTRAGIECEVYVPESTSPKKVEQIEAHGALVRRITGSREDTGRAAIERVRETGWYYASHIYNPLFWEGTKTYVYELYEQFGMQLPETIVVPVGNGTLLMGVVIAVKEMLQWGIITKFPRIVAVQAAACAPLADAASRNRKNLDGTYRASRTLAEGIASAEPARAKAILAAMAELQGVFVTVGEQQILDARSELARSGVYVEITSAANLAGYRVFTERYPETADLATVIPLCGAGLKSAH